MKKKILITIIALLLVFLFTVSAFATQAMTGNVRFNPAQPTVSINGNKAKCSARLNSPGAIINATLELKQGSTVIASWSDTGIGYLLLSGTANVTPGVTYTLTVSGTVNGVAFTPASITVTP